MGMDSDDLDAWKKQLRDELKKELLAEIFKELKLEEKDTSSTDEISIEEAHAQATPVKTAPLRSGERMLVSVKSVLKIASHALKYANERIPRQHWVEVIGLLAGQLSDDESVLNIEDAYPMGHGDAIYAEIKDYKNYVRAFNDIKKKGYFICGWYHSHPSYGLFISQEDFGTQSRYQRLWNRSIALVVDPYMIDGKSLGFDIFQADLKAKKWFTVPFDLKEPIDPRVLPSLLDLLSPIIEGKEVYLEYDEE
jgi:proteasome lid subunit RPN8/RPN11